MRQRGKNFTHKTKSGGNPAGGKMIEKFTIGIILLSFVLSVSLTVYEAGRVKGLEERVFVLAVQTEEALKNSRIARQDAEMVLDLVIRGKE